MMATHLCSVTKNLKIGCRLSMSLPMWQPAAPRGRLCDGRHPDRRGGSFFGVARGYHTREVESFGSPLIDQNREPRDVSRKASRSSLRRSRESRFSHKGKFYTIPPEVPYRGYTLKEITLVPGPEHLPVGIAGSRSRAGRNRAFDFMAKYGITTAFIGGGSAVRRAR